LTVKGKILQVGNVNKVALGAFLVVGAVLGSGIGYSLHAYQQTQDHAATADGARSAAAGNRESSSANGLASLWTPSGNSQVASDQQLAALSSNANVVKPEQTKVQPQREPVQRLMQSFEAESNPMAREALKQSLTNGDKPEVVEFAKRLVANPDPEKRREGLDFVQRLSVSSPEVRTVVMQVLSTENTAIDLIPAILAMKPAKVEYAEAQRVIAQLTRLSHHADDAVRSQSILQLARWDTTGETIGTLEQATHDESEVVRNTAASALAMVQGRGQAGNSPGS
jgi:hypothetical protein